MYMYVHICIHMYIHILNTNNPPSLPPPPPPPLLFLQLLMAALLPIMEHLSGVCVCVCVCVFVCVCLCVCVCVCIDTSAHLSALRDEGTEAEQVHAALTSCLATGIFQ
jgi:hypothetical protein